MFVDEVIARIDGQVPDLANRTKSAADLSTLVSEGSLPQSPVAAFVLPLGFRNTSQGDASANAFTQMLVETIGILLVVRNANDITGAKSLPKFEALIDQLIVEIAGWQPSGAFGVFWVSRGQLISTNDGTVIYQLDFSIQKQVRNIS